MTWTCEQIEERLSEYVDRLLSPAERAEFAAHVESCPKCGPLVARVSGMVSELHRLEPVAAPSRLVSSILDQTLGPRTMKKRWRAWLEWFQPAVQPRFALGAVTVLLTVSIVSQALGIQWTKLSYRDLNPVTLYREADRRAHLVYARGVKFVNDLRVVYEIQSRLRPAQSTEPAPATKPAPGQTSPSQNRERELNRANDKYYDYYVLASAVCGWPGRSLP